jgi:hypothetical protein
MEEGHGVVVRNRKRKEFNVYFRLSELQVSLAPWAIRMRVLHVIDLPLSLRRNDSNLGSKKTTSIHKNIIKKGISNLL